MPTTINGIGTMYYGKKNVQTRRGVCEHCDQAGDLRSYQTRLWFTIVFVPVVPLGKKQIIDECAGCQRHGLMPLGQWQALARDGLSETRQEMEQNPQDEDAALDVLRRRAMSGLDVTRKLEAEIADWTGRKYALAYCNGTS